MRRWRSTPEPRRPTANRASAEEAEPTTMLADEVDAEGPAALAADEETRVVRRTDVVRAGRSARPGRGRAAAAAPPRQCRSARSGSTIGSRRFSSSSRSSASSHLILANGLFFGVGGVFWPYVSPSPPPSQSPSPSASGSRRRRRAPRHRVRAARRRRSARRRRVRRALPGRPRRRVPSRRPVLRRRRHRPTRHRRRPRPSRQAKPNAVPRGVFSAAWTTPPDEAIGRRERRRWSRASCDVGGSPTSASSGDEHDPARAVRPGRTTRRGLRRRGAADRRRPDDQPAVHGRPDDGAAGAATGRSDARDRDRVAGTRRRSWRCSVPRVVSIERQPELAERRPRAAREDSASPTRSRSGSATAASATRRARRWTGSS